MQLRRLEFLKPLEELNDVMKETEDSFRGYKTQGKLKSMHLEVKLNEANLDNELRS